MRNRGSSSVRAWISTSRSSDHSACASTKSMPCLDLFVRLLPSSNSNSNGAPHHKGIVIIPSSQIQSIQTPPTAQAHPASVNPATTWRVAGFVVGTVAGGQCQEQLPGFYNTPRALLRAEPRGPGAADVRPRRHDRDVPL